MRTLRAHHPMESAGEASPRRAALAWPSALGDRQASAIEPAAREAHLQTGGEGVAALLQKIRTRPPTPPKHRVGGEARGSTASRTRERSDAGREPFGAASRFGDARERYRSARAHFWLRALLEAAHPDAPQSLGLAVHTFRERARPDLERAEAPPAFDAARTRRRPSGPRPQLRTPLAEAVASRRAAAARAGPPSPIRNARERCWWRSGRATRSSRLAGCTKTTSATGRRPLEQVKTRGPTKAFATAHEAEVLFCARQRAPPGRHLARARARSRPLPSNRFGVVELGRRVRPCARARARAATRRRRTPRGAR